MMPQFMQPPPADPEAMQNALAPAPKQQPDPAEQKDAIKKALAQVYAQQQAASEQYQQKIQQENESGSNQDGKVQSW